MEQKTKLLPDRTFYFGVNTLRFLKKLPDDYIDRIPKGQVARSSTSIGSNYEEKHSDEFPKFIKEAEEIRNIFAAIKKSSAVK